MEAWAILGITFLLSILNIGQGKRYMSRCDETDNVISYWKEKYERDYSIIDEPEIRCDKAGGFCLRDGEKCEGDKKRWQTTCYDKCQCCFDTGLGNGKKWTLMNRRETWEDAQKYCRRKDGELLVPENIWDVILLLRDEQMGESDAWVGINDYYQGYFEGVHGNYISSGWQEGQPRLEEDTRGNCVVVEDEPEDPGLKVEPCYAKNNFICDFSDAVTSKDRYPIFLKKTKSIKKKTDDKWSSSEEHIRKPGSCATNCVNGACTDTFICECKVGFKGPNCNETGHSVQHQSRSEYECDIICNTLYQNNCKSPTVRELCPDLCSADTCNSNCVNGTCTDIYICECKAGFIGPNCKETVPRGGLDCQFPWLFINTNLTRTCVTFLPRQHETTNIWENAQKACQELGADLPKFTSRNQIDGLYQYLNAWRPYNGQQAMHAEHWIRGYRKSDGKSYWTDDGMEIPDDLFSEKGYCERALYANGTRGPLPTTIEKECLIFRPQPANNNEPYTGIFNNGHTPCDKIEVTNAYTMTMCQKYVD